MFSKYEEMEVSYRIFEGYILKQAEDYDTWVKEIKNTIDNLTTVIDDNSDYELNEFNAYRNKAKFNYLRGRKVMKRLNEAMSLVSKDPNIALSFYDSVKNSYDYIDIMQFIAQNLYFTEPAMYKVIKRSANNKDLLREAFDSEDSHEFIKYSLLSDALKPSVDFEKKNNVDVRKLLLGGKND